MKFRSDDRVVVELEQEIADTRAALDRAAKMNAVEQVTDVNPIRQNLESELARAELQATGLKARRSSLAVIAGGYQLRDPARRRHHSIRNPAARPQRSGRELPPDTRKQEEARIADSLDQQKISNVAIAEAPAPQHLPAKPNVVLNLALGVMLAGFVSVGAAFGAEYSGSTFHTPSEVESATGIPVLATVPYQR